MGQLILVDENDRVVGHLTREEIDLEIYLFSALIVTNEKNRILLAQRKLTKKNDPGKWSLAVAGTNELGETYESNIIKETEEEIGLIITDPKTIFKREVKGQKNFFAKVFHVEINSNTQFKIQEDVVEQVKWFTKEEFSDLVEKNPKKLTLQIKEVKKEILYLIN